MPNLAFGFVAGVALLGVILWRRTQMPRRLFILALAAMLGALRFNLSQPHFDQTTLATRSANDQQKSVIVEGVVVAELDTRDPYTNLRVEADHLLISNLGDSVTRIVRGLVLVQAPPFTDFRYGDRVRAEGKLETPTNTGDFDYRVVRYARLHLSSFAFTLTVLSETEMREKSVNCANPSAR